MKRVKGRFKSGGLDDNGVEYEYRQWNNLGEIVQDVLNGTITERAVMQMFNDRAKFIDQTNARYDWKLRQGRRRSSTESSI